MATRRGTRRRASSVRIDDALLDAAVDQIERVGPDAVRVAAVARVAGVTTGAFYARYENTFEMLVDTWQRRCAPQVQALVGAARAAATDPGELASLLARPDRLRTTGLALVMVAPRIPELAEVVIPALTSWWPDRDAAVPLAFGVGAGLFDALLDAPTRDWGTPLSWLRDIPATSLRQAALDLPPPPDLLQVNTGDEVRDALLTSTAAVISRGGLHRATTSRIARNAGYTQACVFDLWGTRDDLIAETTSLILTANSRITAQFGLAAMAGDAGSAAAGVAQILGPDYSQMRQLRRELVLAAMADPVVAAAMVESDQQASAVLSALPSGGPLAVILADAIRAVVLGLIVLQDTVGGLDDVDFEPLFSGLLGAARS